MINKILFLIVLVMNLFAENEFSTKLNYFGNISLSKLDTNGYHLNNYNHDSVDNKISLTPYTKLGGQITYYNDDFMFTGQALVKENHNSLKADLTWLNVKYNLNDNFGIRAGIIQTKVLINSESLDVDYLQLWAKPPEEVYRLMPVRTYNGLELTYDTSFDEYSFNVSIVPFAFYKGKINGSKDTETAIDIDNAKSICLTLENDNIIYKASFSKSTADISDDASTLVVVNGLRAYGNDMSRFTYANRTVKVGSLGVHYVYDDFSIDTELARSKTNGFLPSSKAGYVMLGYRIDKLRPFVMYAENKNDKDYYDTGSVVTSDATSIALKRGLDDLLYMSNYSQSTVSVGANYEIKTGMILKAQADRISSTNYGSVTQTTVQSSGYEKVGILSRSAGTPDKDIYAFTMSLSFAY